MKNTSLNRSNTLCSPQFSRCKHGIALLLLLLSVSLRVPAQGQSLQNTINAWIPNTGLGLTLDSASFQVTATAANLDSLRQTIVNDTVLPNGTVSDSTATVTALSRVGDQGFTTAQLQPYLDLVTSSGFALAPGDQVFQLNWTLSNPGLSGPQMFSTLGYEDASGNAKFEPWLYTTPLLDGYITVKNTGASVDFSTANIFTTTTEGHADLIMNCNAVPVQCDVTKSSSQVPLWEATISNEPVKMYKQNGVDCCSSVIHYGFVNGFKSIKVGADGVTLEVSGSLGWGGTTESKIVNCCPEPGTYALFASLGLTGAAFLRRKRAR